MGKEFAMRTNVHYMLVNPVQKLTYLFPLKTKRNSNIGKSFNG